MKFDPRCFLIDRAHLDKVRAIPEAKKALRRELDDFEQSAAQAVLIVVTPKGVVRTLITEAGLPCTQPPSLIALQTVIEAALHDYIPAGVVGWSLLMEEPALSDVRDWLDTTGARVPSAPLVCLPNDGVTH